VVAGLSEVEAGEKGLDGMGDGEAGLGETAALGLVDVDEGFDRFEEAESAVSLSSAVRLVGNVEGVAIDERGSSSNIK
jgi:hypothetical protein